VRSFLVLAQSMAWFKLRVVIFPKVEYFELQLKVKVFPSAIKLILLWLSLPG
jgi:hypothetical protein